MTQTDEQLARRKRVQLLKKLIIIVPLTTIILLMLLCIFLAVRLYMVQKELRTLRNEIKETAVIDTEKLSESKEADFELDMVDDLYEATHVDEYTRTEIDLSTQDDKAVTQQMREVYLTFDDGPSSNTARILDILKEYDVKATFFVTGKEEPEYQVLYKRIVEEGHTLAMHSYSHRYQDLYQSLESFSDDLNKLQEFLYETTGVWCRYYRFPGGSSNEVSKIDMHELIEYLDQQDIEYFDWNVSSGDATNGYISADNIVQNCVGKLESLSRPIILMHDAANKNTTVEALPKLIESIQSMENTKIVAISDETTAIHHISNN